MYNLFKSLENIKNLIKAIRTVAPVGHTIPTLPSIKPPAPPSISPKANPTKMPGVNPQSNKDPKKIAEQIKNGSMSTKTQKVMLKTGQWTDEDIEKADKEAISKANLKSKK